MKKMCDPVCVASGSQMVGKNYWPKLEVKSYKMELLLRYVWRVVESDPNIDFKEALKKWVPFITKCGCGTQDKTKSLQDKQVCSLLRLWQSMGGGLTDNDVSYLLLFIERTRTEKKRLNFLAKFNRLKMRYKVDYLKEQEALCVNKGCVEHMQELENLLVMIPELNVEDAVENIQQLQEKNGFCVHGLSKLKTMENDVELQINELERGDGEYMGMLTQADEMWMEMENAFQKSIEVTKEMESTLSSELHLGELSLSKWKEKCAIAEEDEKKAIETNKELQTEVDENTRQSQVLDQELVELSSLSSQVKKNLQNMKTDHGEKMQKLRIEKENYKKNICCLEDALKVKQLCTQKKCQAYDEKILDARHELAKCCKYFLQQSQQREELLVKAKKMNDGKITCAKRCLDSKVLIDSQKQKITSEINEMKDIKAKILLKNICNCNSSTNKCNCVQCKKQKCTYCCCTDLKHQFFKNIIKDILMRLKACNCDANSGIVADLNSVLQCNTSPKNESMLLKTFLLDLVCCNLDTSVSEGLQVTREKVPFETRANVRMCLALPEELQVIKDENPSENKNIDSNVEDHLESNQGSESPIGSVKAELESQNDDLESVKADLGSLNEDLESAKASHGSQNEDLASVKAELDSQNEDLESVKNKSESPSDYSKSGHTESEPSYKDLESENEQLQSNYAEAEIPPTDLASVEIGFESLQGELEESLSATKSYPVLGGSIKDGKAQLQSKDVYDETCSKCCSLSKTHLNEFTEIKKCPVQVPCVILSGPSKSDCLTRPTYKKKPGENKLDTCDCATNQNIFMKNKLVDPRASIQSKKQIPKYSKYQENTCPEIVTVKKSVCNCMSEFRRNDLTPRKSRPCKTNLTTPTFEQSGKYNVSSMYLDVLAKNKHKFNKISPNLLCPYDLPSYKGKRDSREHEIAKIVIDKRSSRENNESVKKKTLSNLERCLQAPLIRKFVPGKQKSKGINTEMTCKNAIKKRRMKKCQV